jgi:hypothetical protein
MYKTIKCHRSVLSRITSSWTESSLSGIDSRHTSAAADAADLKRKGNLCVIKTVHFFVVTSAKEKTPHSDQYKKNSDQLDRALTNTRHVWLGPSRRPSVSAL